MPMFTSNEADFYYEIMGTGQPIILIAGYTCDHTAWLPVAPALSQHFQVVLIDNRGSGQTKDRGLPLSAELMARDIISLMKALDLKSPHLVGSSMGGTIAQYVALLAPEKIGKLCLCNTVVKWRKAMLEGFRALLALREQDVAFDLLFNATLPWIFGDKILNNTTQKDKLRQLMLDNPYPQSLADQQRQYRVLECFDNHQNLNQIVAPTLVLYGAQDIVSLPEQSFFLAERIENASLKKFQSGHVPFLEQPEEFTDVLIKFLS